MIKEQLLDWLQNEERKWNALLDEIGSARMEQPGVCGDWSMKDIVAHLAGWDRWQLARFRAAAQHEPEPPPPWPAHLQGDDEINARIIDEYRQRSLQEILDETQQTFQQARAVLESLPEDVRIERIEPAYYLVWLGDQRFQPGEFFDHFHDDHEGDVRAWLEQAEKSQE